MCFLSVGYLQLRGLFVNDNTKSESYRHAIIVIQNNRMRRLSSKLRNTQNELYRTYVNINELLQIEEGLTKKLGMSKVAVRKGFKTDRFVQPKHVKTRIADLEQILKMR